MNFIELVTTGQYKKEDLSEKSQKFIDGMEFARDCVECMKSDCEMVDDTSVLEKIQVELEMKTIDWILEELESKRCEAIVSFLDVESVEEQLPFC